MEACRAQDLDDWRAQEGIMEVGAGHSEEVVVF